MTSRNILNSEFAGLSIFKDLIFNMFAKTIEDVTTSRPFSNFRGFIYSVKN